MVAPLVFPCLRVDQGLGTFYVFVAPAGDIMSLLTVERRGLTPEAQMKVQRALDTRRERDIAKYVVQPDATFPTSITLNADSDYVHIIVHGDQLKVVWGEETDANGGGQPYPDGGGTRFFRPLHGGLRPGEIVDGQHRFAGLSLALQEANAEVKARLQSFQLPFALMFDLGPEACARIFVTINSTQRKVDSSHIADLFGLSEKRSPKRIAHLIARGLDRMSGSPFENGLKILGTKVDDSEFLSQGSFVKYLLKLISANPDKDEQLAQQDLPLKADPSLPFRQLYLGGQDQDLLATLHNFFTAMADVYPNAWRVEPKEYLLRKTVGYSASMKFLKLMALEVMTSQAARSLSAFGRVMSRVAQAVPEGDWSKGSFTSSDAAAGKMATRMFDAVKDDLPKLLVP